MRERSRIPLPATFLLLVAILSSYLTGCSDDRAPACPDYQVGAIEGYVLSGGIPIRAQVRAIPGRTSDDVRFYVQTDSTGWYRMELPSGDYRMSVLPQDYGIGVSVFYSEMDTVRITRSLRRFDLRIGRLGVQLAVPAILEGRSFSCRVQGIDSRPETARVEDGHLSWTFLFMIPDRGTTIGVDLGWGRLYMPGTFDPRQAEQVLVSRDAPVHYQGDLSALAEVTGSLHGSSENPNGWSLPVIRAFGMDSSAVGETGVERTDRSFALDVFPAQPIRLRIEDRANGAGIWEGGSSFSTATTFETQPGDRITGVDLRESGILFDLRDPGFGLAPMMQVTIEDESGRTVSTRYAYGALYLVSCLGPGRYFARISHRCDVSWAPEWYGGSEERAGATPIEITDWGQAVEAVFVPHEGGQIQGRLLTAAGGSPDMASVALRRAEAVGTGVCTSYLDRGPGFSFRGLANDDYILLASTNSIDAWYYPGTFDPDSAAVVSVRDHAIVSEIEWRLPE